MPQLRQAVEQFFDLENYCQSEHGGVFDKDKMSSKMSLENPSVSKNSDTHAMRIFKLPDGREEFFEWHLRLMLDAWRLFFWADMPKNTIYIDYIGCKLSTKGCTL
jgi:hypothetical protein